MSSRPVARERTDSLSTLLLVLAVGFLVLGGVLGWAVFPKQGPAAITVTQPDIAGVETDKAENIDVPTDVYRHHVPPEEFDSLGLEPRVITVWDYNNTVYLTKYADALAGDVYEAYATKETVYKETGYGRGVDDAEISPDGKTIIIHTDRSLAYNGSFLGFGPGANTALIALLSVALAIFSLIEAAAAGDRSSPYR